jgi:hypothetical protein
MHDDEQRAHADHGDTGEIVDRIEWQLGLERGAAAKGGGRQQDRIAVGRRLGDVIRPDHLSGADAIVHHHRLSHALAHLLADNAGQDVGRTARGDRDDDPDWPIRILLTVGGRERSCNEHGDTGLERRLHGSLLAFRARSSNSSALSNNAAAVRKRRG